MNSQSIILLAGISRIGLGDSANTDKSSLGREIHPYSTPCSKGRVFLARTEPYNMFL
jgi:hypothetical protein